MKYLKLVLALLLITCLAPMPYGYYVLVRFVAMVLFVVFAFADKRTKDNKVIFITFLVLALLFQPFFKIPLGRIMWNIVDVAVAGFLIWQFLQDRKH